MSEDGKVRISKILSERGVCSRREADSYIEKGWVFVDGEPAVLGLKVSPDAVITLDDRASFRQDRSVTILLHKPVGYVSGQPEKGYRPAVALITPENRHRADKSPIEFTPAHLNGLAPAGRLDIDSQGLLIFTQDGRVAKTLIGADSTVEKEYIVRVNGELQAGRLELLNHGLSLDGKKLKPAVVTWLNEDQLKFVLKEGRKRQIRRMCEMVGLEVVGLKRVRVGRVRLSDLPEGRWRYLGEDESF